MKQRIAIPPNISAQVLFQNRHRCCICRESRKVVQIHHIDGNPANNEISNLAVLCLEHHSEVSSRLGFGKDYSQQEVALYKESWESQCKDWHANSYNQQKSDAEDDDEDEEPIHEEFSDTILEGEEHDEYSFELDEENEIVIGVISDEPIDVMIMTKREYERWANKGKGNAFRHLKNQYRLNTSFLVPSDGWYSIVICNLSDEDAKVQVDITTWP